jgi:predicted nucleic acid-binding Zn ribbon protein
MAHAHCVLCAEGYKYTFRICSNYCISTVTMVAQTRLNFMLYLHCWHVDTKLEVRLGILDDICSYRQPFFPKTISLYSSHMCKTIREKNYVRRRETIVCFQKNFQFVLQGATPLNLLYNDSISLSNKPEGRGFDSRWCNWNFSLT